MTASRIVRWSAIGVTALAAALGANAAADGGRGRTAQKQAASAEDPGAGDEAQQPASGKQQAEETDEKRKKEEKKSAPPTFTDNVVVTATRSVRPEDKSPLSATVMTASEVKTTPALTVDDVLRSDPTINLPLANSKAQHPASELLSMRGLGGSRTLVMLDGVPINDPFFGFVQWNKVPVGEVDKVEITRGAGSSLFGNYSLGGTINISTRPLTTSRTAVDVLYGSNDTVQANAHLVEAGGEKFGVGLSVDYWDTDGYILAPPGERGAADVPSASRDVNVLLKTDFQLSPRTRGFARASHLDNDQTVATRLSTVAREILDLAAGAHTPVGGGDFAVTVFYEDQSFLTDSTSFVPGAGRNEEFVSNIHDTPVHDVGGSMQWFRSFAGGSSFVTTGVDLRRTEGEDRASYFTPQGAVVLEETAGGEQRSAGLFGEVGFALAPRTEVLVSGRLDYWKNQDGHDDRSPGGVVHFPDRSTTQFDPRLAVRQEIGKSVAVRGAVYRAFRAPTLNELYRTFISKTLAVQANSQLGPETLKGADVGLDVKAGALRGQFNLFRNDVSDLISRSPISTTPLLTYQLVNLGSTRSQGLEIMADLGLGRQWSLSAGYAHTNATIRSNPQDPSLEGKQVPDIPADVGTLAVRFARPRGLELTVRARSLSQRYTDAANKVALDGNTLVDIYAAHPLTQQLELFAMCTNALDDVYLANVRTGKQLGPPRQFFVGLRLGLARGLFTTPGEGGR